jgi:regulator of replication initiation timing
VSDVPSPAVPPYAAALRETPWLTTLDHLYRLKTGEAERLEAENLKLRVTNETLRRRLRQAAQRQALWEERRRIWRARERELQG